MPTAPEYGAASEGRPPTLPSKDAWQQARRWSAIYDAKPEFRRKSPDLAYLNRSLFESLTLVVDRQPDAMAVVDANMAMTYRQFLDLVCRLGQKVASTTAPPGPLGLLLPDGVVYAAALFAGQIAGRPCVPLDSADPPGRIEDIVRSAGIALVLTMAGDAIAARVDHGCVTVSIDDPSMLPPPDRTPCAQLGPDEPAFILSTSGSTGRPKLLVHSQRSMAHRGDQYSETMELTPADHVLFGGGSPGSFAGLGHLLAQLRAGSTAHLVDLRRHGMRGLLHRLRDYRITVIRAPASLLRTIAGLNGIGEATAHVRLVRFASEQPSWDDVAIVRSMVPPGCRIVNSYGTTEATGIQWTISMDHEIDPIRVPAGIPDAGADVLVMNQDGGVCAPNEVGELVIRSRYNALGEWQDGCCVPGRLIRDPGDTDYRIYVTGDMARQTEQGVFVVLGRADRMIKINGQRVEPVEIESVIRAFPAIEDVAVLARVTDGMTTLMAFVVPRAGGTDAELVATLRETLRQRLPSYMVPSRIVVMDRLPRLSGGKVDAVSLLAQQG